MLRGIAGWLILSGVVYIPWHEGGVAPLSTTVLSSLVVIAALLWLWGHAFRKTRPRVPLLALVCAGLLLLQGWWMVVNAHQAYDPVTHELFPIASVWGAVPGSADAKASETAALNATSMLLALCIVCDLGRYAKWRKRFLYAVAVNGALIAAYGLARQVAGDTEPSGTGIARMQGVPFGTFHYHANAGSFLILCLPAAFALLLCSWGRGLRPWKLVVRGLPLPLIVAGSMTNSSRAAQAVIVLLTMGLMGWAFWRLPRGKTDESGGDAGAAEAGSRDEGGGRGRAWAVALAVLVLGVMIAGAVATTYRKWSMLPGQMSTTNPRLIMWRVCAFWLDDAGPLGYGPGTYKLIYPTTPRELMRELYPRWVVHPHTPGGPVSMWSQVHNDYLQWAFEWGWLGGAMWVVLLVGGFAMAVRAAGRGGLSFFDATLAACAAFALGGLMLHATVDFPLQVLGLQMYAGVYLGLGWGSGRWPVEVREPRTAEGPPVPVVGEEVGEASFKFN